MCINDFNQRVIGTSHDVHLCEARRSSTSMTFNSLFLVFCQNDLLWYGLSFPCQVAYIAATPSFVYLCDCFSAAMRISFKYQDNIQDFSRVCWMSVKFVCQPWDDPEQAMQIDTLLMVDMQPTQMLWLFMLTNMIWNF